MDGNDVLMGTHNLNYPSRHLESSIPPSAHFSQPQYLPQQPFFPQAAPTAQLDPYSSSGQPFGPSHGFANAGLVHPGVGSASGIFPPPLPLVSNPNLQDAKHHPRQRSSTWGDSSTASTSQPKQTPSKGAANPPYLKKQQACLTCKRRKTRCDAVRPICGACSRSQARVARGHGLTAEVPPGPCTYPEDTETAEPIQIPGVKHSRSSTTGNNIRRASIATGAVRTKGRGSDADINMNDGPNGMVGLTFSPSTASNFSHSTQSSNNGWPSTWTPSMASTSESLQSAPSHNPSLIDGQSLAQKVARNMLEVKSAEGFHHTTQRFYSKHLSMNLSNLVNPIDPMALKDDLARESLPQVDLFLRQMCPQVSPDLPLPNTIRHMAELFFSKHPLRHMFCQSTMLARLTLPPNHSLRPHPGLIHAILAAAEPFSPLLPNASQTQLPHVAPTGSGRASEQLDAQGKGFIGISNPIELPRAELDSSLSFGEFHLARARREFEVALLTDNQRPIEWLQGALIVQYCLLDRMRIMEAFFLSANLVRALAPTGLDKMPNERDEAWWNRSMFGVPESSIVEYEQRMAMWLIYLGDVYAAGPPRFYEPCIAEERQQITTTMPILMGEVEDKTDLALSEQTLASDDLYRTGHADTFCLHVKSACLLKRARVLTSRRGLELQKAARPPPEVVAVEECLQEFLASFPKRDGIDAHWIVAEANACVARITLHHNFVGTGLDPNSEYGRGPIEASSAMMMATVHYLLSSSYDVSLLHSQTFVCYLVLVRVLSVQSRLLSKFWQLDAAATVDSNIECVMQLLQKASDRSWRAKTSWDICKAACETELTDDEFADLVYLWQVIPH